jgi:hypothetical protein
MAASVFQSRERERESARARDLGGGAQTGLHFYYFLVTLVLDSKMPARRHHNLDLSVFFVFCFGD